MPCLSYVFAAESCFFPRAVMASEATSAKMAAAFLMTSPLLRRIGLHLSTIQEFPAQIVSALSSPSRPAAFGSIERCVPFAQSLSRHRQDGPAIRTRSLVCLRPHGPEHRSSCPPAPLQSPLVVPSMVYPPAHARIRITLSLSMHVHADRLRPVNPVARMKLPSGSSCRTGLRPQSHRIGFRSVGLATSRIALSSFTNSRTLCS